MRVSEQRQHKPISQVLATILSFGLFFYFAYHLAHGDRGYFAWKGLQRKMAAAEQKLDEKLAERQAIENRVKLLRPTSLDLDLLDERARTVLGFVRPGERVIIETN